MGRPAADLLQPPSNGAAISSRIGNRIGPYEVVVEIGHGGMGEVYRAVRIDGQFDQQVAIKLVRVGMDSAFIVERFLGERQILATLNHPNIARLLDGGATDDGVPYVVMELIEGDRIDAYCQAHRLSVTERLRIFLQVCAAVEYAHQRLVIHRDIKPGNILVTADAMPKLLDFGIAKILDPSGDSETTMARPMTPEYASPEQVRGEPITTASDVYSLGVVLYQLLTGRSPYRIATRSPAQLSQAITSTDPQRPSTAVISPLRTQGDIAASAMHAEEVLSDREPTPARLRKRLSGDLDSILLMALRKEPERRYGSVRQFAEDISRHLDGLPVTATRGSWSYTAGKFVARHRTAVAATAAVILALVAGMAATERQARIARMERARAQKRFDDVRQFSNALIFDIHDALQDIPGTTPARSLLLDRAVQYLDRISADAEGDPDLQRELAWAYQRLATVQGDATVSNVGQVSAAEVSSRKAITLFEAVAKTNPNNTIDQLNVAMIHRRKAMSDLYYPAGRPEIDKALAVTDRLMRIDGENTKVQMERAIELQVLAGSLDIAGEREQSAGMYRQSRDLVQAIAQRDPSYKNIGERIAKNSVELGFELAHTAAVDDGQKQLEAGVSEYARLVQKGAPPDTVRDLAQSRLRLGMVQAMRGDFNSARKTYELARDVLVPLSKADPQNILYRVDALSADFELARLLVLEGRFRDAETALAKLIAGFESLHSEEDTGPGMGSMHAWLGEAQFGAGKFEQALKSFRKSAQLLESDVQYDDGKCGIVTDYVRIGDALVKLRRLAEAETAYRTALSKSEPGLAAKRADLPALVPIRAAHADMGDLNFVAASSVRDSTQRDRLRVQACEEYRQAREVNQLIPVAWTFNPSNFPAVLLKAADPLQGCNHVSQ